MGKHALAGVCIILALILAACAPAAQQPSTAAPKTEAKQATQTTTQSKAQIAADVQELLSKHNTKVSSVSYKYRGPETGSNFYEFYVKGSRIKYKPYLEIKTLDKADSYDTIFIDKTAKTAQSYCVAAYCAYQGKKADLNYDSAYISTILDWIEVTSATKVGEEVIDSRSTWKIDTNKGFLWVDTYYGVPLKVESSGKTYKFEQLSVNSVQDADVNP